MGEKDRKELTLKQCVQIGDWLKSNAERMKISSRRQRLDAIKATIGISCSEAQLARVDEELGFTNWARPGNPTGERSSAVNDRVSLLAAAVYRLYEEVGSKPPAYVGVIRSRGSKAELEAAIKANQVQGH